MQHKNTTQISEFFLRGFSSDPGVEKRLSPLFLSMYLLTLLGNIMIILLIRADTQLLQTPMYFFLSNLAVADLAFASTVTPKVLVNIISGRKTISYYGCLAQMFSNIHIGNADSYLLASMAYDRYVAICCPLNYSAMMSHKRCLQLATASWTITLFHAMLYTFLMSRVEFCDPGEIPHFYCDLYPVLDVSCSDTKVIDLVLRTEGIVEILGPFVLIIISYAFIFITIIKIPSSTGKRKAFSTCGAHICVVVMYFGGISFVYFKPNSNLAERQDTWAAMVYTMVNPMVNPFIYTLRNQEMKAAMKRVIKKHFHSL